MGIQKITEYIKKYRYTIAIVGFLIVITLLPRILDLETFLTADERRWHSNVTVFTKNVSLLEWKHLLQLPHPGITLQWLAATAAHSDSWAIRKLPLAIGESLLIMSIGYIFWRLWGSWPAVLLTALL